MKHLALILLVFPGLSHAALVSSGDMIRDTTSNLMWKNPETRAEYDRFAADGWRVAQSVDLESLSASVVTEQQITLGSFEEFLTVT